MATSVSERASLGVLLPGHFLTSALGEAAAFYRDQGFVVLSGAFNAGQIAELRRETAGICRNEKGLIRGISSVELGVSDEEAMKRVLCVHFPHKLSGLFQRTLAQPVLVNLLTRIIGPNVKAVQSMLFVKAAGKPGQAWHQDEDFIPTRDRTLTGAWIALDDATVENGCLWVLPRSQQRGILWPQKIHFDTRFDCTRESFAFPYDDADAVSVEVKTGDVVFFNGYLLHRSLPNVSAGRFRRALVHHYMSAESLLPWFPEKDVGMAVTDYRDIVMVAGEDPYAYKGTPTLHTPFVRPDGQGGCADWTDEAEVRKDAALVGTVTAARVV